MRDGPEGDRAGQAGLVNDLLPDAPFPVSGRDQRPGALVDADVVGDTAGVVEEDQVAAPRLADGNLTEGPVLGVRGPRDGHAEVVADHPGAAGSGELLAEVTNDTDGLDMRVLLLARSAGGLPPRRTDRGDDPPLCPAPRPATPPTPRHADPTGPNSSR